MGNVPGTVGSHGTETVPCRTPAPGLSIGFIHVPGLQPRTLSNIHQELVDFFIGAFEPK